LVTELGGDSIAVFSVPVQDAEDECVSGGIVGHDKGILVLFTGVVGGVAFLGYAGVFGYCASEMEVVLQIMGHAEILETPNKAISRTIIFLTSSNSSFASLS
jgi:hypothetical protein